jgi:hypothetical protein
MFHGKVLYGGVDFLEEMTQTLGNHSMGEVLDSYSSFSQTED